MFGKTIKYLPRDYYFRTDSIIWGIKYFFGYHQSGECKLTMNFEYLQFTSYFAFWTLLIHKMSLSWGTIYLNYEYILQNDQREVILNVALEQQLINWLCKCASDWANGSFSSAGCSLELLTSWAFRRAVTLKRKCENLCRSLRFILRHFIYIFICRYTLIWLFSC